VSCPDWRRLDPAWRDAPGALGARWEQALDHFDLGCPSCRPEALAADPTLVFRRLPVPGLGAVGEADEVAAARLAVAAMRTASRLRREEHAGRVVHGAVQATVRAAAGHDSGRGSFHALRWALAAGLATMALLFGSGHGIHDLAGQGAGGERAAAAAGLSSGPRAARPGGGLVRAASAGEEAVVETLSLPAAARSSVEGLRSRPEARVYQIDGPQMSVVMIVDDKLDV